MKSTAELFVENTPARLLAGIPPEVLDQAMAQAFSLFQAGDYARAEILCRGLLAADHTYWWAYSLYAAVLTKQGQLRGAFAMCEAGLKHEPGQPKLLAMRAHIVKTAQAVVACGRKNATAVNSQTSVTQEVW